MAVGHGVNPTELHRLSLAGTTCCESLASQLPRTLLPHLQVVCYAVETHMEKYKEEPAGVESPYTPIISCVTHRKMESVEYSGAEHRDPDYQTQQLSSISAATEPTLSSYYVWYITMS